ncbi:MAG TPA: tetratricopeptide repeat protein [Vicinamibacterales bacterium]|nr:tetratricopeptide repeat protein [Vicinamibacterales bacterium]
MSRVCALVFLLLLPAPAAAQKGAFIEALLEFHSALSGTYGDEGPRVEAALDRMDVALEAWNAESRLAEASLRAASDSSALARFFLNEGRPADALEAVEEAIRLKPERAGLHMLRGVLLGADRRDADALASFQRAWALDPDDVVNAYLLADALSTRPSEPPERQLASLLAAIGSEPPSPMSGRDATRPDSTGQAVRPPAGPPQRPSVGTSTRRASFIQVGLIDDSASEAPQFSRAAYADGVAALANGRYEDAIGLFRAAMVRDPLVVDHVARSGPAARGVAALRQGQTTDAVADLEAAVAAAPSSSEARRLLGVAHATAGNVDASLKWLAEAIRVAPADERAHIAMGRVLMEAGRIEEAERVLLDTLRLLPASGRTRWALADLYELTGRDADAIDQLEQAATLTMIAGKTALLLRLASFAHELLDEERVISAFTRQTRLMRNNPLAHRSLGLAYHRAGRDVEALVELLVSSHLGQEDAETLAVMGQIHLNAGRLTMAETMLRRAVAIAPDSAPARYALSRTLLGLDKEEEGRQQLAEFERLQERLLDERRQKYENDLRERNERLRGETTGK